MVKNSDGIKSILNSCILKMITGYFPLLSTFSLLYFVANGNIKISDNIIPFNHTNINCYNSARMNSSYINEKFKIQ